MKRRKMILQNSEQKIKRLTDEVHRKSNPIKTLWKHPLTKILTAVGAVYGILFVSKYIISECADVVIATKKLKNARNL